MQNERRKYSHSPFKLLSHSRYKKGKSRDLSPRIVSKSSSPLQTAGISQDVSSRYKDEIAPPTKMKEYDTVACKYKQLLVQEAKSLQLQYIDDIKQVREVEESVERIANMLSEFVQILHSQTDQVEEIYDSTDATNEFVKKSNNELQSTINRSKSHQWNMIFLVCTLALLLLILDFLTP